MYPGKPKTELAQTRKTACRNKKLPGGRSEHETERISEAWDVGIPQRKRGVGKVEIKAQEADAMEGKNLRTYKEDIEQKRLWLERKIKRELKIVINAIIDKVIWKGCNLDVLVMAVPQITRTIVHTNLRYQTEFPKRESQKLEADIKSYAKKEVCRCYEVCERKETL